VGAKKMALEAARVIGANLILDKPAFQEKKLSVPKLGEYYQSRLTPYMKLTLKRSTYITFESAFRVHILPQLGRLHLDQIDRQKMEGFISKLVKKDMAKDSIRLILAALSCLYTHAVENQLVTENPAKGVSKLYKQVPSRHKKPEPLTVEESLAFLSAALTHDPEHYPIFLLALHSGLRSGEIGGLQWPDIDWNGKFLSVRRAIV
jgi:integrase